MDAREADIARIAGLAVEFRKSGKSMQALVRAARYAELRAWLTHPSLASYFAEHPELVDGWERYSEDKRTSEGWYFSRGSRNAEVGYVGQKMPSPAIESFTDPGLACATFVLRELDSVAGQKQSHLPGSTGRTA